MKLLYLGLTAILMTTFPVGASPIAEMFAQRPPPGGMGIDFGTTRLQAPPRKVTTVTIPEAVLKPVPDIDTSGIDAGNVDELIRVRCANEFIGQVNDLMASRAATYDFSTRVVPIRVRLPHYWQSRFVPAPLYEFVAHPEGRATDDECKA